ncbi:hypothetical protein CBS76997_7531 [Aspergillus niger]|nr:hypothetical protein CBS13152_7447 [Aspergillus niger]KAI3039949.1 hypothetical protein CBS76997_7531 [Aspergillus niger]
MDEIQRRIALRFLPEYSTPWRSGGPGARTQLLLTIDCYPPTSVNEPLKRYRALRIPTYAVSRTTSSADIPLGFSVLDPTQKL